VILRHEFDHTSSDGWQSALGGDDGPSSGDVDLVARGDSGPQLPSDRNANRIVEAVVAIGFAENRKEVLPSFPTLEQ
jgi:hypothetical protein